MAAKKKATPKTSAAKMRMAEEKSKAKAPLTSAEKRDFFSMQNAIAEMGMKQKLTGRTLQQSVGAYKKYNVKDSEITGALYSSLKKDYAKFVTPYMKKKK